MKFFNLFLLFIFFNTFLVAQNNVSFEEFDLPLDTFLNDADETGFFQSRDAFFPNSFNPDFGGFWESGWAISTMRDDTTSDFSNLYGAKAGGGFQSNTYIVGQQNTVIRLTENLRGKVVNGLYLTNGTYPFGSMGNGDDFAKKFGGEDGTDPDFFKVEIRKFYNGELEEEAIDFYLADFRFEEDSLDYIIADWQWVDLSNLGNVDSLQFTLLSSDIGEFGINTPLFFCMDNLEISNLKINIPTDKNIATFEEANLPTSSILNGMEGSEGYQSGNAFFPTTYNPNFGGFWESGWAISSMRDNITSGFFNLYSAKTGSGSGTTSGYKSFTYAVGQQNAIIRLTEEASGKIVKGLYITNGVYAHNSMRDGDDFAKKFGGENGTDPDFFKLEIRKYSNGALQSESIDFYLADFRFEEDSLDYIVNDWQWVDLSNLGNVDSLQFTLSSSDVGDYGFNTPLFFCIDNFETSTHISTGIEELVLKNEGIKLYPNPAIDEITIELTDSSLDGIVQVFDLMGRQVLERKVDFNRNRLDVSMLKGGAYLLYLKGKNRVEKAAVFIKK